VDEGVYSVVLRKKSGVVEVRRLRDGTGDIVSTAFKAYKSKGGDAGHDDGEAEKDATG
jgi:RAT1-interacting protein